VAPLSLGCASRCGARLATLTASISILACSGEGSVPRGGGLPAFPAGTSRSGPAPGDSTEPGGSAAPEGPGPDAEGFTLLWRDDFDAFDASRWQLMTHSWDSNLAQFSTDNTRFADGIVSLLLTPEPTDAAKPFRGVEMRSI
jgi:hypothetical protein